MFLSHFYSLSLSISCTLYLFEMPMSRVCLFNSLVSVVTTNSSPEGATVPVDARRTGRAYTINNTVVLKYKRYAKRWEYVDGWKSIVVTKHDLSLNDSSFSFHHPNQLSPQHRLSHHKFNHTPVLKPRHPRSSSTTIDYRCALTASRKVTWPGITVTFEVQIGLHMWACVCVVAVLFVFELCTTIIHKSSIFTNSAINIYIYIYIYIYIRIIIIRVQHSRSFILLVYLIKSMVVLELVIMPISSLEMNGTRAVVQYCPQTVSAESRKYNKITRNIGRFQPFPLQYNKEIWRLYIMTSFGKQRCQTARALIPRHYPHVHWINNVRSDPIRRKEWRTDGRKSNLIERITQTNGAERRQCLQSWLTCLVDARMDEYSYSGSCRAKTRRAMFVCSVYTQRLQLGRLHFTVLQCSVEHLHICGPRRLRYDRIEVLEMH